MIFFTRDIFNVMSKQHSSLASTNGIHSIDAAVVENTGSFSSFTAFPNKLSFDSTDVGKIVLQHDLNKRYVMTSYSPPIFAPFGEIGPQGPIGASGSQGPSGSTGPIVAVSASYIWRQSDDGTRVVSTRFVKTVTDEPYLADSIGIIDSLPQIQAAINNKESFLGDFEGHYKISGSIIFPSDQLTLIRGRGQYIDFTSAGYHGTVIQQSSTEHIPMCCFPITTSLFGIGAQLNLENVLFVGNGTSNSTGLSLKSSLGWPLYSFCKNVGFKDNGIGVDLTKAILADLRDVNTFNNAIGITDGSFRNLGTGTILSGVLTLSSSTDTSKYPIGYGIQASLNSGTSSSDVVLPAKGYVISRDTVSGTVNISSTVGGSVSTPSGWPTGSLYFFNENTFGAAPCEGVHIIGGRGSDTIGVDLGQGHLVTVRNRLLNSWGPTATGGIGIRIQPKQLSNDRKGPYVIENNYIDASPPPVAGQPVAWGGVWTDVLFDTSLGQIVGRFDGNIVQGMCRIKWDQNTQLGALGWTFGSSANATGWMLTIPPTWFDTKIESAMVYGPILDYGQNTTIVGASSSFATTFESILDTDLNLTKDGSNNLIFWGGSNRSKMVLGVTGTIPVSTTTWVKDVAWMGYSPVIQVGQHLAANVGVSSSLPNLSGVNAQFMVVLQFMITTAPNNYAAVWSANDSSAGIWPGSGGAGMGVLIKKTATNTYLVRFQRNAAGFDTNIEFDGLLLNTKYALGFIFATVGDGRNIGVITDHTGAVLATGDLSSTTSFSIDKMGVGYVAPFYNGSNSNFVGYLRRFLFDSSHQASYVTLSALHAWTSLACEFFKTLD